MEDPRAVIEEQAADYELWRIMGTTRHERMLQAALRRLHEAVEGKTKEQCARAVLD
jgi:hypothetical protein